MSANRKSRRRRGRGVRGVCGLTLFASALCQPAWAQDAGPSAPQTPRVAAPVVQAEDMANGPTAAPRQPAPVERAPAPVIQMNEPIQKNIVQMRRDKIEPTKPGISIADVPLPPLEDLLPPPPPLEESGPVADEPLPTEPVPGADPAEEGAVQDDASQNEAAREAAAAPPEVSTIDDSAQDQWPPADPQPEPSPVAQDLPAARPLAAEAGDRAIREVAVEPATRPTPPMGRITDIDVRDTRTAAFHGVTPGVTTTEQMRERLGPPSAQGKEEGEYPSYLYELTPFPKVEFVTHDDVVNSIVVTLPEPAAPEEVAEELKIGQFRSAAIFDTHGGLLGYVFPERGIILNLDANGKTVSQILIEPVRAQFFVIRARNDSEQKYRHDLADLNYAIQLDPNLAEAYWLKSKIFTELGRYKDALQLAEYAVERAPRNQYYKLQQARLVALNGDFRRAEMIVDRILSDENSPALVQARAHCLMGDLFASGPKRDLATACEHHRAAITLAAPYWNDSVHEVSRMAVQVLIDANLAVANDIAWGRWSKKDDIVPKWLETAANVIDAQAGNSRLDSLLTLQMYRRSLMALAGIPADSEYREIADAARQEAASLITGSDDSLFKSRVEWELGEALYQSMRCALKAGNQEKALEYAEEAIALVEQSDDTRQITTHQEFVYGQLYYLTGSIHALAREDHQEAVRWYRKATPYLTAAYPRDVVPNSGVLGDQIVSIGVSYWKTDNRQDAINVTKEGVTMIRKAIGDGQRDESSLAVPYANLATMLKLTGQNNEANSYARLAERLQSAAVASQPSATQR